MKLMGKVDFIIWMEQLYECESGVNTAPVC